LRKELPPPDEPRGSGAGVDAELGVNVVEVLPHSPRRDPKALSDLSVRLAVGYEIQDLPLARCELRRCPGKPPIPLVTWQARRLGR
jgi:hypothetical protein